jgi:hypothetical protein
MVHGVLMPDLLVEIAIGASLLACLWLMFG